MCRTTGDCCGHPVDRRFIFVNRAPIPSEEFDPVHGFSEFTTLFTRAFEGGCCVKFYTNTRVFACDFLVLLIPLLISIAHTVFIHVFETTKVRNFFASLHFRLDSYDTCMTNTASYRSYLFVTITNPAHCIQVVQLTPRVSRASRVRDSDNSTFYAFYASSQCFYHCVSIFRIHAETCDFFPRQRITKNVVSFDTTTFALRIIDG